jgi:magnesium-transporting ATPase (P-type)
MRRRPRRTDEGLLTPFLLWRVVVVSILFMIASLGFFFYALGQGEDIELARTMAVNMIVVLETVYLFNIRYLHMTSFTWRGALGTPAVLIAVSVVIAAQFAFTYLPFMNRVFGTQPLSFGTGVVIVTAGVAIMALLEIEKLVLRRAGRLTVPA